MKYTNEFKSRVLSVIRDSKIKDEIENGKLDLGDYLIQNAFKGIDSKIVLECLNLGNYDYLKSLAREQEIKKALYQEWFEYYVMKSGPALEQQAIKDTIELEEKGFTRELIN